MAQHVYTVRGTTKGGNGAGWSEAANEACESLFERLERKYGEGKVKFVSVKPIEFTAEPHPNPGSIQTFGTTITVTVEHP
ncbi:MAG TPA: hypothetical protein VGJ25_05500 [Gaiellaceae bacterium]|jgi:hypothetical protein